MNLSHYSDDPIVQLIARKSPRGYPDFKPFGFWISVDGEDDWAEWCKTEDFRETQNQYHYRVHLKNDANILHLKSALEILNFHDKYADPNPKLGLSILAMRWDKVAEDYQGLIIAPYCWEMRLDGRVSWYYGWDCASGCIWDHTAIDRLELIREPAKEKAA